MTISNTSPSAPVVKMTTPVALDTPADSRAVETGAATVATTKRRIMPDREKPAKCVDGMPILVTARQAATLCGKSLRTWRTWDSAGWIPRPVRIGRSTLWRADELREWAASGCPRRDAWEARK